LKYPFQDSQIDIIASNLWEKNTNPPLYGVR